jgi:hypothetical protein
MRYTSATGGTVFDGHTPGGGIYVISNQAIPVRIHKYGGSLAILLVKQLRDLLPWRAGDFVAVRVCGEKLVIERLALEKSATIRTGETAPYQAALLDP